LDRKNLEIKELRDEIVNIKLNLKKDEIKTSNLVSLGIVRAEISMADEYIRALLKDNVMNYIEDISETDIDKITNVESLNIKVKRLSDKFENMYGCNCTDCLFMRKSTSLNTSRLNMIGKTTKEMMISKNVNFQISFPMMDYMYTNNILEENVKKIILKNKVNTNKDVSMTFTLKKTKEVNLEEYDFSLHKDLDLTVNEDIYKVSFSSIMVVNALRSLKSEILNNIMTFDSSETMEFKNCFKSFISRYVDFDFKDRVLNKISDLTEEEEIVFLSSVSTNDIFIYIHNGKTSSIKNHISNEMFEKSVKMKAHLMVTPMFRDISFYADDIELDEEYEEIYNINLKMKSNSTSTNSNKSLVLEGPPTKLNIDDDFVDDSSFPKKMDEFYKMRFKEFHKNKGMKEEELERLSNSKLAYICLMNKELDPSLIKMFNMSFREFKAIAYFSNNMKKFTELVLNNLSNGMKQMYNTLPKMFYEMFSDTLEMREDNIIMEYTNFLFCMDEIEDFKTDMMRKLFEIFKFYMFNYMYLTEHAKSDDYLMNERNNYTRYKEEKLKLNTSKQAMFYQAKIDNMRMMNSGEKMNISRFQPNENTRNFFKNLEPMKKLNLAIIVSNMQNEEETIFDNERKLNMM